MPRTLSSTLTRELATDVSSIFLADQKQVVEGSLREREITRWTFSKRSHLVFHPRTIDDFATKRAQFLAIALDTLRIAPSTSQFSVPSCGERDRGCAEPTRVDGVQDSQLLHR